MMRCVCGDVELVGDGSTAELAGIKHRSDGPCYHCDEYGEPMHVHEVDVMPGMVIRPGDVLVIACNEKHLEVDRAKALHDALMQRMPGLADIIVLAAPLSIAAVYRDDPPEDGGPVS